MNSNISKNGSSKILGIATVNEKGQVVIPVEAREAIDLKGGDKLLVIKHGSNAGVLLVKPDRLEKHMNQLLEQLTAAKDSFNKKKVDE